MNYWNSRLSRFDAHCGLYNGSIINCDVTFFSLIGKGEFIIKDTNWYSASTSSTDNALIYLRGDYGSTWDGEIKIQNLNAYTAEFNNFKLVYHGYKNWYYGYTCCFPSIEIDNLKIYKQPGDPSTRTELAAGTKITFMNYPSENNMHLENTASVAPTRVFYNEETGTYSLTTNKAVTGLVNDNPITPPEYIRFLNNEEGYDFTSTFDVFMARSTFFNNTRIVVGTKKDGVITEINVINPGKSEDNTPILPFD